MKSLSALLVRVSVILGGKWHELVGAHSTPTILFGAYPRSKRQNFQRTMSLRWCLL
jgi:hypothetical protein